MKSFVAIVACAILGAAGAARAQDKTIHVIVPLLAGSGTAERVEGGYRVTARKIFASSSPAGNLLMTRAIYDDPTDGPTVLHFPVSLDTPGVKVADNWRTLGMRGTGSNDIIMENVFVPDAAISGRLHRIAVALRCRLHRQGVQRTTADCAGVRLRTSVKETCAACGGTMTVQIPSSELS